MNYLLTVLLYVGTSRGTVSTMTQTSTDARGAPYTESTCHVAAIAKAVELRAIAKKRVKAISVFCIPNTLRNER